MRTSAFRRALGAALCSILLLTLPSCSDDDGPTAPVDPSLNARGNIGPEGGSISSADGRLVLTVPAGALAAETEIVIRESSAKDVTATGEGMQVTHAFTLEPAGLEFAEPATLRLGDSEPTQAKEPGLGEDRPLRIALLGAVEDKVGTYRALPEQELTMGPTVADWALEVTLRFVPTNLVYGFILNTLGGLPGPTFVRAGSEVPNLAVEQTQFNAQIVLAYSLALTLAGDVRFGPAAAQNLVTLLEEGDVIDVQSQSGPGDMTSLHALISYVAGVPGPATWNMALKASFDFQAALAFPESADVPLVLGTIGLIFTFTPVSLAVQEVTGVGNELLPGLYLLTAAFLEAGHAIRGLEGFPYNNALGISSQDGTALYSLARQATPSQIYSGFIASAILTWSNVMMSAAATLEKAPDPASIAMVQAGPGGARLTPWFPENNAFGVTGFLEFRSSVPDVQPFDADPRSGGFVYVAEAFNAVRLLEFNPDSRFWDNARQISDFPDAPAAPFTAAVRRGAGAVVVTSGSPGRIYHHDLVDTFAPAVSIGDAGDSPRRVRTAGDLAFVSNFDSDELTVLSWTPAGVVSVVGSVTVGDGPVGIDALELGDGRVAVVSTGFNDHTSTLTVVDAAGSVISNVTTPLPGGALAPGHAFWLRGEALHFGVTCNESGHLVVIDSGLE